MHLVSPLFINIRCEFLHSSCSSSITNRQMHVIVSLTLWLSLLFAPTCKPPHFEEDPLQRIPRRTHFKHPDHKRLPPSSISSTSFNCFTYMSRMMCGTALWKSRPTPPETTMAATVFQLLLLDWRTNTFIMRFWCYLFTIPTCCARKTH